MVETIGRRILTVSRTEQLTPRYKRIYLTGQGLSDGFPFVHMAPTDHVKVLFPQPGSSQVQLPERGPKGWLLPEGAPKPIFRDYTVRGWLPKTRELVLEFVIHGEGVASARAAAATPGAELGVMGPRANIVFPQNYSSYLLAGDEAVLPALARFAAELPEDCSVKIVGEVANAAERLQLTDRQNVSVSWVLRDEAGQGGLESAVRALPVPEGDDWFVFAAGEAGVVKQLRDYFRLQLKLPKERVVVDGYWKRGVADLDHHSIKLNDD
jgi:NADPH-dependent ferric siderophore reductase